MPINILKEQIWILLTLQILQHDDFPENIPTTQWKVIGKYEGGGEGVFIVTSKLL